jgi:Ca2+-binding EF-hand superfamily protein
METYGLPLSSQRIDALFKECTGTESGPVDFAAFSLLMLKREKL